MHIHVISLKYLKSHNILSAEQIWLLFGMQLCSSDQCLLRALQEISSRKSILFSFFELLIFKKEIVSQCTIQLGIQYYSTFIEIQPPVGPMESVKQNYILTTLNAYNLAWEIA